jgi:iron complex outermembrane receptor protein
MQAFADEDGAAKTQTASPDTFRVAQVNPVPATSAKDSTGNELEEVIITAEHRTADIQNTAASVSVRTGDELADQGRVTVRQIMQDIPGVVAVDNNSRNTGSSDVEGNNITIRGIAAQNSAAGGVSGISAAPGTAVYVDGVYEGIGSGYDIDRVEVLRGPQGTLYGRSATTGVVAFHTRDPSFDSYGGNAAVEFGNYDLQHYTGAVNLPLSNVLAIRVSGDYYDQREGFYNEGTDGQQTNTYGRAKLLWKPNDDFSLLMGVAYEKREGFGGGTAYTAHLPTYALTTTNTAIYPGHKESDQYWAEANLDLGPVRVTYLPTFRTWVQDDTTVNVNMFLTGDNSVTTQKTPIDHFLTHELRVASKDDAAVKWQGGFFYYHNDLSNNVVAQFETPAGVPGAVTTQSNDLKDTLNQGVFGETTIPLTPSLRATLGARYDDTKVVVSEFLYSDQFMLCGNGIGVHFPLPPGVTCTGVGTATVPSVPGTSINGVVLRFHNFNYKARLEGDLTPKNMLYGMISTGFRPGDAGVLNGAPNILAAEKLTSFEVGSKNRFLNDSLQLNAGLYYYNYQGFQTMYDTNIFNPLSYVNVTVPAHNVGGELELLYRLTAHDLFGLNGNYVESRWYDKPAGFSAAYPQIKRAMTPYTMNGNYTHRVNLANGSTLSARIDGQYQAAHLSTDLQEQYLALGYEQYVRLPSQLIGNLSAVWASNGGRYSLSAYVRNFTDAKYNTYTVSTTLTQLGVTYNDPRTYGAQASVHF